ncbi:MAG: hypothetical protein CVU33_12875 [Betaproteobacteria bacterium HGW-Betaproteobacteria-6]|jgi:hypothetical protein|nr:MAG: hypothetical protein CVU33_12875 [Betaproteobacteria bacterium HGW-Betaproteobacteria-6]
MEQEIIGRKISPNAIPTWPPCLTRILMNVFKGNREREDDFRIMRHLLTFLARTPEGRGNAKAAPKKGAVDAAVEHFYENYVHDSFEHFSLTGGTLQTDASNADYYHLRTVLQPVG